MTIRCLLILKSKRILAIFKANKIVISLQHTTRLGVSFNTAYHLEGDLLNYGHSTTVLAFFVFLYTALHVTKKFSKKCQGVCILERPIVWGWYFITIGRLGLYVTF